MMRLIIVRLIMRLSIMTLGIMSLGKNDKLANNTEITSP
jgi:hypothetical protein